MKSKQIFFYGLQEDLLEMFKSIESKFDIKYAQAGMFDEKILCLNSLNVNTIGNVQYGDWNHNPKYLLLPKENTLQVREVPQKKGGIKYAVDQMKNKDSVVFYLGGFYMGNSIIASKIGTISNTDFSKNIIKHVSNYCKTNFENISGFYVSKNALEKSKKGVRLTTDVNASSEYDLSV